MGEVVDTLQKHLEEELRSPGKPISSNFNDILLNLKLHSNQSDLITTLAGNREVLKLLIEGLDTKVSLIRALCPVLYSWVTLNTDQSIALVCEFIPSLIWSYLSTLALKSLKKQSLFSQTSQTFCPTKVGLVFVYLQST